jgi:hypothetical protein
MLSSGALAIWFTYRPMLGQYVLPLGEATERGQTQARVPSTLLGPEEAAASLRAGYLERPG